MYIQGDKTISRRRSYLKKALLIRRRNDIKKRDYQKKVFSKKRRGGFTLIELIVTIAIIGILVLMATPKFMGHIEKAQAARILSDSKVVERELELYRAKNNDDFPEDAVIFSTTEIDQAIIEGRLYTSQGGLVTEVVGETLDLTDTDLIKSTRTSVDGRYLVDGNGNLFYLHPSVIMAFAPEAPVDYLVTFKNYDGTVLKEETVSSGSGAIAPEDPLKEGHLFTGWDVDFSNVTTNLIITAEYGINDYTVTFNDHDGTIINSQSVSHGSSATAPSSPTRTGYAFVGWDVDFSNVTSDLTVIAEYSINVYSITFDSSGGSIVNSEAVSYGSLATKPARPTKDSYAFDGWYKSESLTESFDFSTPITVDATIYAKWVPYTFDYSTGTIVGYNTAGGTSIVIPSTIDGVTVASIGDSAFNLKSLTSVVLPSSVTSIGSSAFRNNDLTHMTISDNVTAIGAWAFSDNAYSGSTNITGAGDWANGLACQQWNRVGSACPTAP